MSNTDRQDNFELVHEIEIDASPDLVFRFFTDPALLERWFCVHAGPTPPLRVRRGEDTRRVSARLGALPTAVGHRGPRR